MTKRRFRPSWHQYFIDIAMAISKRSTCIRRQYGSIIVNNNIIISTGYNGAPRGVVNCIDEDSCVREELNIPSRERYELCLAVHSEQNAIMQGNARDVIGGTIYIAGTNNDGTIAPCAPCLMCCRAIINAQIALVIYMDKSGSYTMRRPDQLPIAERRE